MGVLPVVKLLPATDVAMRQMLTCRPATGRSLVRPPAACEPEVLPAPLVPFWGDCPFDCRFDPSDN